MCCRSFQANHSVNQIALSRLVPWSLKEALNILINGYQKSKSTERTLVDVYSWDSTDAYCPIFNAWTTEHTIAAIEKITISL